MIVWLLLSFASEGALGGFAERPQNESVMIGESVLFKCTADKDSNNYELYSQWRISTGTLLGFHDAGKLIGHQGRYSYVKETPEELHLKIEKVTLEDDGQYECQMLRPGDKPLRAAANLDVIVPPVSVLFTNYQTGGLIDVNEDSLLNITCTSPNAKPEPDLLWYISGMKIEDDIEQSVTYNLNKTATSYSSLLWRPRREDDNKVLTCEAQHPLSKTQLRANITLNVLYPSEQPIVSVQGGDNYVKAGDNVTIVCLAKGGNPPPAVIWFLNDKPVSNRFTYDFSTQETRNVYSFVADSSDHQAEYECRSSNREGLAAIASTLNVKVAYAPQGVDIYGEHSIKQGSIISVQCRSKPSNPASRISWLVNGHPVPTTIQSEHEQPNGIVSISNLSVNSNEIGSNDKHRIVIECNARNDEGTAAKHHTIKVLSPPLVPRISGLEDQYHLEGELINITCEAHGGNPLADITWFRGYDKVGGARSSVSGATVISMISLTLDRSMNGQKIRCEAFNSALDEPLFDSKPLTVLYPPRRVSIRTPEGSRHQLIAGKESKLLCSAPASNPPADLSWQFHPNGDVLPLILKGETILNETTRDNGYTVENVISFTPTDKYDGTLVRCIASHPLWSESKNVTLPLNIYYAPKLIVDGPITVVVTEGDSFRENLTVLANPPVSAWRWRKNSVPFDQTIGGIFARGAMLSGRQLKDTDAGLYTLFAVNNVGTTNVSFNLIVEYPAKVKQITSPVTASVGDNVVLECEVDGVPKKKDMVKWMKKGHEVASEKRGDTKATLRLVASYENAGKYTCVASNGIGEPDESHAHLLVNRAPQIVHLPSHSRGAGPLGGKARIRCRAHAVPDAEFAWYRGSEQIRGNNSKFAIFTRQIDYSTFESILWISNISPDDYNREVKCHAFNRLGEDTNLIPVSPLSPPDMPMNLHSTNSTSDTIALSWTPGFDGGADQTFEVRYQKEGEDAIFAVNTTHSHVRLSSLIPASNYLFQLRSHNARGFTSEFTRPVQPFSTLTEDGVDISRVIKRKAGMTKPLFILLIAGAVLLVICNFLIIWQFSRIQRRKKIQEKTEIVRTSQNGDGCVRPVQMYGTMNITETSCRAVSGTNLSDANQGHSDDESVRTMIEVNPNGYMQQIDPAFYERNCLVDYEFDPRGYSSRDGTLRQTYANVPYPEPPREPSIYSERSLTRRSFVPLANNNNNIAHNNNNGGMETPQHMLSTFIQPSGVRAGPILYSQLDGDLV